MVAYQFAALGPSNFSTLCHWMTAPHVRQWYGGPEGLISIRAHLADPSIRAHIVQLGPLPLGYLQAYKVGSLSNPSYAFLRRDAAEQMVGIDQFIGPRGFLNRGHGSAFIRAYLDLCRARGITRVVVDPKPDNERAIAAYQKAGFQLNRHFHSPVEGDVVLMVCDLGTPTGLLSKEE